MNLRKAAEDLLEGVEAAIKAGDWKVDGACDPDSAIIALRQALAQPEQEPVKESFNSKAGVKEAFNLDRGCWERGCMAYDERDGDSVNISEERVDETAKRKHEPVAWMSIDCIGERYLCFSKPTDNDKILPLYTAPPSIEAAVLAEREAMVVEAAKQGWSMKNEEPFEDAVKEIVAIRARGEK